MGKEEYVVSKEVGVSWLKESLKEMKVIDLGDKTYRRK